MCLAKNDTSAAPKCNKLAQKCVLQKNVATFSIVAIVVLVFANSVISVDSYLDDYYNRKPKPTYAEAQVGSYVVFDCPINFPQDIPTTYILRWFKDSVRVFSWYDGTFWASESFIGRINLLDNVNGLGKGSVNLTAIRETDSGWYQCMVYFPNRTPRTKDNGTWFHLSVDGGALLRIPPINVTVLEGDPAHFHCTVKNPKTMVVTWYKDDQPLTEMEALSNRCIIGHDGSLTINPTEMSDLGEYECSVKDDDQEQRARAFLNVQYKAKVVFAPNEVFLPFGQPAVLDCHFRSNPPLTNLRWEKDGFLFDPYNVQGVFYKRNGSLFFDKVDESHAGRYSCTPYNELGTAGQSPSIHVVVQRPPQFTIKPKLIYLEKLGTVVRMDCDARDRDGTHQPFIKWQRKDEQSLPQGRYSIDRGTLVLENIEEDDRGVYTCMATNEAATITVDTELLIENVPPRAPYNLTGKSTDTTITLKWVPGYIRSNVDYNIWYRKIESPEWRTMKITDHSAMEGTITNLEPDKEYEVMILCQDMYGDGTFSKTFRYFTKTKANQLEPKPIQEPLMPFAAVGPPRNLTVEKTQDHDYIIRWEAPDFGRENLRLYILRWWIEPTHELRGTFETRETNFTIKNLEEDEIYTFQVYSLSGNDYEAGSNEYELLIPPYRRIKAIVIGSVSGLIFLLAAVFTLLYMKRHCLHNFKQVECNEKF